jgi:hypothetical protein
LRWEGLRFEDRNQLGHQHRFRHGTLDLHGVVHDRSRHTVHVVTVCEFRELGRVDGVGGHPIAHNRHLVRQQRGARTVPTGRRHEDPQMQRGGQMAQGVEGCW